MFTRPTLDELIERTRADLATRLGLGQLVPRGFLEALARSSAGMLHGLYGFVEWASRQVLPDTGDVETLERWANDLGVPRKVATFATGQAEFTGTNGEVVPADTLVQRADAARYRVVADVTIASGVAVADLEASTAGALANAGSGTVLTLLSPITGINSTATVEPAGIVGGVDQESDADLLERVLQRMGNPPQGGAKADYVRWALEVAGVTRAWCLPEHFGAGTVGVTFAVDNDAGGPIPTGGQVATVQAYIDDATRKPVPADVTVFAPGEVTVDLTIDALEPDTPEVRASIEAALVELIRRDGAPGQPLLISHVREAISNAPGERDHVLTTPTANVAVAAGSIPVLGTITWT